MNTKSKASAGDWQRRKQAFNGDETARPKTVETLTKSGEPIAFDRPMVRV
ncbi:MAG TPA: hypothetical protein VJT54_09920 [Verrucomicrobiae bacterium]|nr:hypothetical protein [Verrucomicrobiae bacterium]